MMYYVFNADGIKYTAEELDKLLTEAAAEHPKGQDETIIRVAQRTGIERGLLARYVMAKGA